MSYADVEFLTRTLLLQFSFQMDTYQDAGKTEDTTEALIAWVKAEHQANRAAFTDPSETIQPNSEL